MVLFFLKFFIGNLQQENFEGQAFGMSRIQVSKIFFFLVFGCIVYILLSITGYFFLQTEMRIKSNIIHPFKKEVAMRLLI